MSDLVFTKDNATPTPPAGTASIYAKGDGLFYTKDESGTETPLKGATGDKGDAGPGVPTGGSSGQVLTKNSNTNYDASWVTPSTPIKRFTTDLTLDGVTTLTTVSVAGTIDDARLALWQLRDIADSYCIIFPEIRATMANTVTIIANPALPAGNYRLIGIQ